MKKTVLSFFLMGVVCIPADAQLEVQENGHVSIGVTDTLPNQSKLAIGGVGSAGTDLYIHTTETDGLNILTSTNKYGINVSLRNSTNTWSGTSTGINVAPLSSQLKNHTVYGVHVQHGCTSGLSFGVCSQFLNVTGPYAAGMASIYGSSTVFTPSLTYGRYAGYFDGDVKVAGGGTLYATVLTPSGTSSQQSRGTSFVTVEEYAEEDGISEKLGNVRLIRMRREQESVANRISPDIALPAGIKVEDIKPQTQLASVQYGLAADQLKEVYPELVYEDENGNVSINYIEMIPLLVQANNELRARITALEGSSVKPLSKASSGTREAATAIRAEETVMLSLGQNNPNPFSEQTSIEVSVPESVTSAALLVFDVQGKLVKKLDITDRGTSRITVMGQGLSEGMYLYSLVADGKVVRTRKMILSK